MSKNSLSQYLMIGGLVLVVGAGSFVGGTAYQKGKDGTPAANPVAIRTTQNGAATAPGGGYGSAGGYAGRRGGMGGGMTVGQVTGTSSTSITLQTISGTTQTVDVTGSTAVSKTDSGSLSDISAGDTVTVAGSAGSDGNIQATTITIRPASSNNLGGAVPGAL